jgi:hypothetical protein
MQRRRIRRRRLFLQHAVIDAALLKISTDAIGMASVSTAQEVRRRQLIEL